MGGSLVLRTLNTVEARHVPWLWPGFVPLGKLTLLAGDPGLGKSFITLDLASKVTTAHLPPAGSEGGAARFIVAACGTQRLFLHFFP